VIWGDERERMAEYHEDGDEGGPNIDDLKRVLGERRGGKPLRAAE
jgi:hypothetical protein